MSGVPELSVDLSLDSPAPPPLASPVPRYSALSSDYNALPTYPSRPSYREFTSALSLRTQCVMTDGVAGDRFAPSSVPIYQVRRPSRGAPCRSP